LFVYDNCHWLVTLGSYRHLPALNTKCKNIDKDAHRSRAFAANYSRSGVQSHKREYICGRQSKRFQTHKWQKFLTPTLHHWSISTVREKAQLHSFSKAAITKLPDSAPIRDKNAQNIRHLGKK
jgi:hypothetical protein